MIFSPHWRIVSMHTSWGTVPIWLISMMSSTPMSRELAGEPRRELCVPVGVVHVVGGRRRRRHRDLGLVQHRDHLLAGPGHVGEHVVGPLGLVGWRAAAVPVQQ